MDMLSGCGGGCVGRVVADWKSDQALSVMGIFNILASADAG